MTDDCRELKVGRTIKLFDCEWLVEGIHLGELGQESLVQIKSMTHKPGWTGEWEYHPMMFVPEPIISAAFSAPKIDFDGLKLGRLGYTCLTDNYNKGWNDCLDHIAAKYPQLRGE